MAPGCLVHQSKRFRRSRSLIVFGPEAISVIVKNTDFACAELLSQRSIHGAQLLRCQPGQGRANLAHGAHETTITSPGNSDKRIVSRVWRSGARKQQRPTSAHAHQATLLPSRCLACAGPYHLRLWPAGGSEGGWRSIGAGPDSSRHRGPSIGINFTVVSGGRGDRQPADSR